MAGSTGIILAAGGIVAANELIFTPVAHNQPLWQNFNWRIIPATAIAAVALAGVESFSPPLGKGLAILALLGVLFKSVGNADSVFSNVTKYMGNK